MKAKQKTLKCEICGIEIKNNGGKRKYCSRCRRIRDRELVEIRRQNFLKDKERKACIRG